LIRATATALLLLALGLIGLAAHSGGLAAALWQGALYVLPALLLAIPLLVRRYPGERLLGLLRSGRVRLRARVRVRVAVRAVELLNPHGGRLIALSLAGRAPPSLRTAGLRLL
jgi:hypothetical protein